MPDFEALRRDYVRLLIREGVRLQPGQRLVLSAAVDQADIARACAEEAYDAGCREVIMNWSDDALTRMRFLRAESDVFDTCAPWRSLLYNSLAEEGAAWLFLDSDDPENLKGVDPDRIRRSQVASGKAVKKKDLAQIAISYGYVYVAQIAMGAGYNQASKAIREAES